MIELNEPIFPIVTYNPDLNIWNCLGTGYFINPVGAFITAKHLFFDDNKQTEKTLFGIQNVNNNEYHLRPVKQLIAHKNADIMIGLLGSRRIPNKNIKPVDNKYFSIDLDSLNIGDNVYTYAYPKTERKVINKKDTEFKFTGEFSNGKIVDYHLKGSSKVKNRCYQTSMKIESGASGGPVLKNGHIVAINSSSFDLVDEGEPISFITPIDYILDLTVKQNGKKIRVTELIDKGYIVKK